MKFSKLAVAFSAAALSTGALAADFGNFYAGVGIGAVGGDLKASMDSDSLNVGQTTAVGSVDLGYSLPINKEYGVALGATFDFSKTKFGEFKSSGSTLNAEGKEHYSIYVQPFVNLSPSTSAFAKVGYHSIKGELKLDSSSESKKFHGVGYGLGIKTMVTKNGYVQAEALWVDYSSKDEDGVTFKPKTTAGIFTFGFQY